MNLLVIIIIYEVSEIVKNAYHNFHHLIAYFVGPKRSKARTYSVTKVKAETGRCSVFLLKKDSQKKKKLKNDP